MPRKLQRVRPFRRLKKYILIYWRNHTTSMSIRPRSIRHLQKPSTLGRITRERNQTQLNDARKTLTIKCLVTIAPKTSYDKKKFKMLGYYYTVQMYNVPSISITSALSRIDPLCLYLFIGTLPLSVFGENYAACQLCYHNILFPDRRKWVAHLVHLGFRYLYRKSSLEGFIAIRARI